MAIPDYLLAADNHNIGNVQASWLNPGDWGVKFGNVGKFAATSILSGLNSFYNTGATVGRWIGLDTEENNTQNWISGIDSDLGAYYRVNQESVDLGGFVLGALVPGLAGVKVFNAGQKVLQTAIETGSIGGNLAKATGLLIPKTDQYIKLAAQEINSSVGAAKLLNANTARALASGLWQNTLEAAAAETVIQTTMFKSPILEQQDVGDIVTNIAVGGVLGGAISGAFTAAKLRGQLKAAISTEDIERLPYAARASFFNKTPAGDKIISLAYDADISAVPVPMRNPETGEILPSYTVDSRLYQNKIQKTFNEIRDNINTLSTDGLLGNLVASVSTPFKTETGYATKYMEQFNSALKIARASEQTKVELDYVKALAKGDIPDVTPVGRWVKLIGEDAGKIVDTEPANLSLGDLYEGPGAIRAAVKRFGFSTKTLWNASEITGVKGFQEAEARHIWASKLLPQLKDDTLISIEDIPLLERAYTDKQLNIKIVGNDPLSPEVITPKSMMELYNIIKDQKVSIANKLLEQMTLKKGGKVPIELSEDGIAKVVNVKKSYLQNNPSVDEYSDLFAHQDETAKHLRNLKAKDLSIDPTKTTEAIDSQYLPKWAKVVYDLGKVVSEDTSGNVADAMVYYKAQQKIYQEEAKNVVAKIIKDKAASLPDITDTALANAGRNGAGPGLISFQNGNYGSIDSTVAWIGSVTRSAKQDARSNTAKAIESTLVPLGESPQAAIEFEGINQKVTRSGQLWVRHTDETGEYLITKRALARYSERQNLTTRFDESVVYGDKVVDLESVLNDLPEDLIKLENPQTSSFIDRHIQVTGQRTNSLREIRAQQGKTDFKDPAVFRPIRPDLRNYPHFAFVRDPRVTGAGHQTMLHAASEKELDALISKVPPEYQVITKTDVEEFKQARHEYEYARTLNENYIDSNLANRGIFSNFFPKSDPTKIVDDILQQHYRESDLLVQEAVRLRYENIFNYFEDLGKTYAKTATSRFASSAKNIEKTSDNPYFNIIKTALDISKAPENTLVYGFNKLLDEGVSKAVNSIKETFFSKVKTPQDLEQINSLLDQYGIKPAYYDAALQALANHTAPKGELTKFVRRANSLLSLFTLGLDPLNAVNNGIGSNILRFTELRHLTDAIAQGNSQVAGELAAIAKIKLPGTGDEIFSPTKLVSKAISAYFKDENGALYKKYTDMGLIKSREDQLRLLIDDFTLKGTETVSELESRMSTAMQRLKSAAQTGERASFNTQVEAFNRFISANVMDQITDIGVRNGIIDSATANAYINTFVNRVEGNIIASQRPLIFQGPIGQAISLFQSYQFNLLQQLFRYVAEGSRKDVAMLAGLQSTLYGIQSLPAFQFINTHIVGQLSGNTQHRDAYDATYGAVGRTAGDWLLYGIPSNILQTNIYSRGDINPRQITVLPTSLQEIPIVQGWGKFFINLKDTFSKIAGGGNIWESVLQGLEHNGISRPLAGFAQTLQAIPSGTVYSTSSKGDILYSNDLFHLATLSRLAGGRSIDEAVVNDGLFRVKVYEASRRSDMLALAEKVKTTLIQDETATADQVNKFAAKYAELGGKQGGFNQWMMQLYKNANVSQAQQLANSLKNPFANKMQLLMGGEE